MPNTSVGAEKGSLLVLFIIPTVIQPAEDYTV